MNPFLRLLNLPTALKRQPRYRVIMKSIRSYELRRHIELLGRPARDAERLLEQRAHAFQSLHV